MQPCWILRWGQDHKTQKQTTVVCCKLVSTIQVLDIKHSVMCKLNKRRVSQSVGIFGLKHHLQTETKQTPKSYRTILIKTRHSYLLHNNLPTTIKVNSKPFLTDFLCARKGKLWKPSWLESVILPNFVSLKENRY